MTDKFYKVKITAKERIAPSMYNPNSRDGQSAGIVIKVPGGELIPDTDSRSDAKFVKTETGWYQPAFYQNQWYMEEVPDPSEPEEPPVPFPGNVQDFSMKLPGIVLGQVILNDEEWVRKK